MHATTTLHSALAIALAMLASPAHAQSTVVIPNGCATAAGTSQNMFAWGSGASVLPGLRQMCIYDSTHFTNQGITSPILITRLRWRPDDGAAPYTGGTFAQARVELSTAPMDWWALAMTFDTNHGADRTLVHSGPVTHPAGNGGTPGIPAAFTVDIPLATPFVYDPNLGDLVIDCDHLGGTNFSGGSLPQMDAQVGAQAQAACLIASSMYPLANGAAMQHGVVVEVTFVAAAGAAMATPYGAGCYDTGAASFYERFAAGMFDLGNTGITLVPIGNGYAVMPSAGPWFTPVAPPIALQDNSLTQPLSLGFVLNYPGGSTSAVTASSNGFAWAQTPFDNGCCAGNSQRLLQLGARWCPLWTDLNPATPGGTVHFDVVPANNAAYLTFTNVAELGTGTRNTFQIAFFANGNVEYRFGPCQVVLHATLTGWSPGNGALDPGSRDLSASLPIATSPDVHALRLAAGSRPIVGTNVTLTANHVPPGALLGAFVGGVTQHLPGLPLASIGMAGCFQHISLDATIVFVTTGTTGTMVLPVPNVPVLSGTHLFWQAAAFASGLNPLGVISSNGLDLMIGTQ